MNVAVETKALTLASGYLNVFGPLSLTVPSGKLCLITGETASGKSALLLALSGRMRGLQGDLFINGINAQKHPYRAIEHTSIAQLGNYIAVEDRLTVSEAVAERAYIDNLSFDAAQQRFNHFSELLGLTLSPDTQVNQYDALTQRWFSVVLAILRPARAVFLDDADLHLTPVEAITLYQYLTVLAEAENMAVIASGKQLNCAPAGTLFMKLVSNQLQPVPFVHANSQKLQTQTEAPTGDDLTEELPENMGVTEELQPVEETAPTRPGEDKK